MRRIALVGMEENMQLLPDVLDDTDEQRLEILEDDSVGGRMD